MDRSLPALAFAARSQPDAQWGITLLVMLVIYGVGLDSFVSGLPGSGVRRAHGSIPGGLA